jgi:hypothetical protein
VRCISSAFQRLPVDDRAEFCDIPPYQNCIPGKSDLALLRATAP